jgi:hypothetical protein
MNQLSFTETRAHRADPETSREAAKYAASGKATAERIAIREALERVRPYGMTPKEIASETGIGYIEVQRRMSETGGIFRTTDRRDGCYVWHALESN